MGSTVCVPPMAALILLVPWRWLHRSTTAGWLANAPGILHRVGMVLLRGQAVGVPVNHLVVARDAFEQADAKVAALGREFLKRTTAVMPKATEIIAAPSGFDDWREAFRILHAREVWETFGSFVTQAKLRPLASASRSAWGLQQRLRPTRLRPRRQLLLRHVHTSSRWCPAAR